MSEKLYPPHIEGTLPAFAKGNMLIIPFQLNRAVGRDEFTSMSIILKTVQTNTILCDGISSTNIEYDNNTGYWRASFVVDSFVSPGLYYKVQVAFINGYGAGYYSDVGIVKCTTQPDIYIKNMTEGEISNSHFYEYTGVYSQAGNGKDKTEKVYSYRFDLYDEENKIVATSGEQIHNTSLDTERFESSDVWLLTKDLRPGHLYGIQYTVTTLNKLTVSSPIYNIMQVETASFDMDADLQAEMNYENGFINVRLVPKSINAKSLSGNFLLLRSSNEDSYSDWKQLHKFTLTNQKPDLVLWQDFTVQQGLYYRYALQTYNDYGLYSNKIQNVEGAILADFEDAFLFDGERQLNIRFNPKITSFKNNVLETKMDTLGGQYPFIFRNGNVSYKEFPISGLISALSDPDGLFLKTAQNFAAGATRPRTEAKDNYYELSTNLTTGNFYKEREFKMRVLDWLNNGKPKLFRSPGEGSYIVRLMNSSLAPNDTLGRMLHTFTATAYEIAECNFENLIKYNFISSPYLSTREMIIRQLKLVEAFDGAQSFSLPGDAYFISFSGSYQKDLYFNFYYSNGEVISQNIYNSTGQFSIPISEYPVIKIEYVSGVIADEILMTFGYYSTTANNNFSYITKVSVEDKTLQKIGEDFSYNIINDLEDIRLQTGRFYQIKISPRLVYNIYVKNDIYYSDSDCEIPVTSWDANALYRVVNGVYWLDGSSSNKLDSDPSFLSQIDSNTYSLNTSSQPILIVNADEIDIIKIGNGLILEATYQLKTLEYSIETTDSDVATAKEAWETAKVNYENAIAQGATASELTTLKRSMDSAYLNYISVLEQALNSAQEG